MSGGTSPQGDTRKDSQTKPLDAKVTNGAFTNGNDASDGNPNTLGHNLPGTHGAGHDHGIPLNLGVEVFDLNNGPSPDRGGRKLLSEATLADIDPRVTKFNYNRAALRTGVVHLGAGNLSLALVGKVFHDYAQAQGAGSDQWGVCTVSLRSPGRIARLARQDNLYTVIERDGQTNDRETVVGILKKGLFVPPDHKAAAEALDKYPDLPRSSAADVLREMTKSDTKIITLTVTQNGYYLKNGELDLGNEDIRHDLIHPHEPKTVIGYLVESMRLRREAGLEPFAVISFDNLPDSGKVIGKACARFAEELYGNDPQGLASYINVEGRFPVTMVDRITPDIPHTAFLGPKVVDERPVMTEPFWHVVIQDWRLPAGNPTDWMPDWKKIGIETPHDVTPYAKLKARMVNCSHTVIASLGQRDSAIPIVDGSKFVYELFQRPEFEQFMRDMMHTEFRPTLDRPPGLNMDKYIDDTLARFANLASRDGVLRLAEEGTRKVPKYILVAIQEAMSTNPPTPYNRLAVATASWMISAVTSKNERGELILRKNDKGELVPVKEQEHMVPMLESMTDPRQLLEERSVMGNLLPQVPAFRAAVEKALKALERMTVMEICAEMHRNGGHIP